MAMSEAITIWAQNNRENTFSGFWQKISEAMDKDTIFLYQISSSLGPEGVRDG
jgi:hypothetical protein